MSHQIEDEASDGIFLHFTPLSPGVRFRMAQQISCDVPFLLFVSSPRHVIVLVGLHTRLQVDVVVVVFLYNWKQREYVFKNTHIGDVWTRPESRGKTHNSYRET